MRRSTRSLSQQPFKPSLVSLHLGTIHQLDIKNAFLQGILRETVYCQQPAGFVDPKKLDHVCLLSKSLYSLKQAPCAWYNHFTIYIRSIVFHATSLESSLFVLR